MPTAILHEDGDLLEEHADLLRVRVGKLVEQVDLRHVRITKLDENAGVLDAYIDLLRERTRKPGRDRDSRSHARQARSSPDAPAGDVIVRQSQEKA